jgi:hypothetical protein
MWKPVLIDAGGEAISETLPLAREPDVPLRSALSHLPLPGLLVPVPQAVQWGTLAAYHIQLRVAPLDDCSDAPPCYEAVLLDAEPDVL